MKVLVEVEVTTTDTVSRGRAENIVHAQLGEIIKKAVKEANRPKVDGTKELFRILSFDVKPSSSPEAFTLLTDPNVPPVVGDTIYVGSSYSIDHGEDDVCGGLATVRYVKNDGRGSVNSIFVAVVEHPGRSYNWSSLVESQKQYQKEYKDGRAHECPDYG